MKTRKMKRLSYRKTKKINNNKYLKKTKKQIKNKTRKNKTRKNKTRKNMIHKRMIHKKKIHKKMTDKIEGGGGKYTYNAPWYTKQKIEKIKKINAYENENPNKTLVMAEDLKVGKYYRFLDSSENVNVDNKDEEVDKDDFIKIIDPPPGQRTLIENIQNKKKILELTSKTNNKSLYNLSFYYGTERIDFTVSPYYVFELVTIFAKDLVVGQEYMLLDDDVINMDKDIIIRDTTSMENKKKENILHYLKKYKVKLLNKKKEKINNKYELNFNNESIQIDITVSPNYVFMIPSKEEGESRTEPVEEGTEEETSDTEVVPAETAVVPAEETEEEARRKQRLLNVKQTRATKQNKEEKELNSALDFLDEALAEYST